MYYWNKDNFEGLLDLALEFEKEPELIGLSEYCKLREKGLRKQALHCLRIFLREASSWNNETSRCHALTILSANARTPKAHQFMTHPLLTDLLIPVLEQWLADNPSAIVPLRWLGLLRSDRDALRSVLSRDPTDVPVRRRLICFALSTADYATHHLSESILLLTVEETRASIAAARQLIASAPDSNLFSYWLAEADEYEQMLDDWEAWNNLPIGTFPEWCLKLERNYSWPTVFYYDDTKDD